MTDNPFESRVMELEAQAANLREAIASTTSTRNAEYAREQSWAQAGNYGQQYQEASAAYNAAIRRLQVLNENLAAVMAELESAKANRDRIATATAAAIASGLDPASAMQQAIADQKRSEGTKRLLTMLGIGLLILLLVGAFVWYRRKK